jgi:Alcohol dehydrogenase GroES-like domain
LAAEVLEIAELPDPHPRPGRVGVAVRADGINPTDWKLRSGMMGGELPQTTGREVAGVVDELGEGVMDVAVGETACSVSPSMAPARPSWHCSPTTLDNGRGWLPVCYYGCVIVSLHAATGATMGAGLRSRTAAALLGIPLHLAGDRVPHRDIPDRRFEMASGLLIVGLVARRRGLTDKATIGALTACLPDVEHVVRLPRPGGSKLFHGRRGWHRSGGLSPSAQLLIAALLVGRILATPSPR